MSAIDDEAATAIQAEAVLQSNTITEKMHNEDLALKIMKQQDQTTTIEESSTILPINDDAGVKLQDLTLKTTSLATSGKDAQQLNAIPNTPLSINRSPSPSGQIINRDKIIQDILSMQQDCESKLSQKR